MSNVSRGRSYTLPNTESFVERHFVAFYLGGIAFVIVYAALLFNSIQGWW